MIAQVLTVENQKVKLHPGLLLVPEFKDLYEKQIKNKKDPLTVFTYFYLSLDPESPYQNLAEEDRSYNIQKDLKKDWNESDIEFVMAKDKFELMYTSPIKRLYDAAKVALDNISSYLQTTSITDGKEGNYKDIVTTIQGIGKLTEGFKAAEQALKAEVKTRGDRKRGYDE